MIFNNEDNQSQSSTQQSNERVDNSLCRSISREVDAEQALAVGKNAGLKPFDVICGKCSLAFNNVGNRRFRVVIGMNVQRYMDAPTRGDKARVIASVVKIFQEEIGSRFVKQRKEGGGFVPVSDKIVRSKVGHALRDLAAYTITCGKSLPLPRSSSFGKAKKRRSFSSLSSNDNEDSCASNNEDDSWSTQQSTQSAPANININININNNKTINLLQTMDDGVQDDSWADDLSVGSMNRPMSPEDIFPMDNVPAPLPEPPAISTDALDASNWATLDDEDNEDYALPPARDNAVWETILGKDDKMAFDFSDMKK